ncbi:MAG: LPS export ABC transporter ATP-binding protein [Planctomycetaceae bacterium]|nr:LPS export ABC transporter ATP-binding protein [Planctomycetaceae bacterium]
MFESAKGHATILKVEGLIKIYGSRRVVDGVSFYVNKGEIVGLLGPNGAGKTTSFRMACGLINTNGGIVYLGNQNVTDWPMYRRSRDGGMGYLPQDRSVFQKLTVQNNLHGVMEMLGMKKTERKRRCEELLEKFNLTYLRQSYGGSLSGGERRRLEIARSLVSNPKIILLDEPFAAIDPVTVASIQEIIRNLAAEGIAILITDHSVQDTLEITKRSYVIQAGKVLCHGTPAEVTANPEAQKFYFGDKSNRFRTRPDASDEYPKHVPQAPTRPAEADWTDPDWEVPKTATLMQERKREPIGETSRPFPLRFTDSEQPGLALSKPTSSDEAEESGIRSGKRLRPISSSITPDLPPVRQAEQSQDDPPMSSIIRNLGQLIWKK